MVRADCLMKLMSEPEVAVRNSSSSSGVKVMVILAPRRRRGLSGVTESVWSGVMFKVCLSGVRGIR